MGLLLAAGRGRRFDASGQQDKLLQPMIASGRSDRVVASQACERLRAGTQAVLAVIRPDAPATLGDALRAASATVVVCADADLGMGHSLAHAVRSARTLWPELKAVLVMPADLPWVAPQSVQAVSQAVMAGPESIVVPVTPTGERGHPVGFESRHFEALERLTGDAGARALLATHPVGRILLQDPGIVRDVDTPADLPSKPS